MRKSVAALVLALVAALGVFAPAASAATGGPKVVIIVGATHGATAGVPRRDADEAYAEAIKYTSNVVKVYSPNATWSKVKAAVKGASIVIYFGHGNGWPSPYTYDPKYTTKDGFGLNATAGNGDYNNKYYGEPYVSTLDLAPNAVVLLHHLCYASGNSEPGNAAPSVTTARKRVDNYARRVPQGRRRGGHRRRARRPRAVHPGAVHDPRDDRGGLAERPELPRPRDVVRLDADAGRHRLHRHRHARPAGYYRSLVGSPGLTTDEVTGATTPTRASTRPALVVPGNAAGRGRRREPRTATPTAQRDRHGRRRPARVRARRAAGDSRASTGTPRSRSRASTTRRSTGWVAAGRPASRATARRPRSGRVDAAGGRVLAQRRRPVRHGARSAGRFSETVGLAGPRSSTATRSCKKRPATATTFASTWDGLDGGAALPDGDLRVRDPRRRTPGATGRRRRPARSTIDTVPPELGAVTPDADAAALVLAQRRRRPRHGRLDGHDRRGRARSSCASYDAADDRRSARASSRTAPAPSTVTWDGDDDDGHVVPDGLYDVGSRRATGRHQRARRSPGPSASTRRSAS